MDIIFGGVPSKPGVLDSIGLAFSPLTSLSVQCIMNQKCHVHSGYKLCLLLTWDTVLGRR